MVDAPAAYELCRSGGSISVVVPDVAGLGLTQINGMIDAKFGLVTLFVLLAGKIVTAYCLNAGFFRRIWSCLRRGSNRRHCRQCGYHCRQRRI